MKSFLTLSAYMCVGGYGGGLEGWCSVCVCACVRGNSGCVYVCAARVCVCVCVREYRMCVCVQVCVWLVFAVGGSRLLEGGPMVGPTA